LNSSSSGSIFLTTQIFITIELILLIPILYFNHNASEYFANCLHAQAKYFYTLIDCRKVMIFLSIQCPLVPLCLSPIVILCQVNQTSENTTKCNGKERTTKIEANPR